MLVIFLIIVVKGIMRMKILLVSFNHYCKRYHINENIACYFFEKFNNRHALCIRLIGLNK